jgi:phosphoglycerate dehydrogenase-like enzyme
LSRLTVLLTRLYEAEHLTRLRDGFPDVHFAQISADAVVPADGARAEVLVRCYMSKPQLKGVLAAAPELRWIHTCTAGFDQLLIPEVVDRGLLVTRSARTHNVAMAEFVLGYMLSLAKRFPAMLAAQAARTWQPPDPDDLAGKTVGIIGAGAIGSEVARRCRAFDMRVIGLKRTPVPLPGFDRVDPPNGLPRMLAESDFVLLACPLTSETRGMIAAPQFKMMKPTAYLLNIARGGLVADEDLIRALREGWIAGAALDAFTVEPLPPESPLWTLERAIITPHCSYRSPGGTWRGLEEFESNLRRYLAGERLENQLKDPVLGY